MHRIDTADSVDGRFDDGDENLGREGTVVGDNWLNAVQDEILAPIVAAGIIPDTADNAQLLAAIRALLAPALPRTGEIALDSNPTPRTGWVFFDDGTIGPSGSGASTRANDDTHDLFFMYWNNYSNALLPVSYYGRGSSAQADWDAGRTIRLPRVVGRALAVAGNGSGLTNRAAGSTTGNETHSLSELEGPAHDHLMFRNADSGTRLSSGDERTATTGRDDTGDRDYAIGVNSSDPDAGRTGRSGRGAPHNNMQPTSFLYARVKL